jgi:shikimate kinase
MSGKQDYGKSIILMGMKHSGKSTLGGMLAWEMKVKHVDLDDLVEEAYRSDRMLSCREIFRQHGKEVFMDLERQAAAELSGRMRGNMLIASLGGGTIENPPALVALASRGVFVYLRVDADVLFRRISKSGLPPFLSAEHPQEDFNALYSTRTALLERHADITVVLPDAKIQQSLGRLTDSLKEYGYAW